MTGDDLELLHGYFDGRISAKQFPPLQALLRHSAEARRMLRDLSTVETKLRALAAPIPAMLAFPADLECEAARPSRAGLRFRGLPWRPVVAAAACVTLLAFGALFTSRPPSPRDSEATFASAQHAIARMPPPTLSPMPEWISPTASMLNSPGFPH